MLLVFLAGLIVGALTLIGQGLLPGSWNHFANSGAVWLLAAFFAGSSMPGLRRAGVAGVVVLFGALAGYTAAAGLMGFAYTLTAFAFWGVVALAGGPIFGAAGRAWRAADPRLRVMGVTLLGAVFIAEGWFMIHYNQDFLAGWVSIVLGAFLALVLGRSTKERLYTLLCMLPISGLGMAVFALINQIVYA